MVLVWRQPFCSCVLWIISEIIFIRFLNFSSKVRKQMEERIKERIKRGWRLWSDRRNFGVIRLENQLRERQKLALHSQNPWAQGKVYPQDILESKFLRGWRALYEKVQQKRTDVLFAGYTFFTIHAIICLTGRKAGMLKGSINYCRSGSEEPRFWGLQNLRSEFWDVWCCLCTRIVYYMTVWADKTGGLGKTGDLHSQRYIQGRKK